MEAGDVLYLACGHTIRLRQPWAVEASLDEMHMVGVSCLYLNIVETQGQIPPDMAEVTRFILSSLPFAVALDQP